MTAMTTGRRFRVPVLLLALAALLVCAATASAETRSGESTTVATEFTPTPEATILKATAAYETGGNATFEVTAAGPPSAGSEGEMWAALVASPDCEAPSDRLSLINALFIEATSSILLIRGTMGVAGAVGITGSLLEVKPVTATKSVSGTTTTFTGTSSEIANREFDCAIVGASDGEEFQVGEGEGRGSSFIAIPLVIQAEPPPPPASGPSSPGSSSAGGSQASPPPAAPAPVPPALSIARLKPLALRSGKWQSVTVRVTNTGAGASAAGSLRLKAPNGVLAKPERQQLPTLAPGHSFTLTFRVQLTTKAKKKSTVSVTASAPGTSVTSSLSLKLRR